MATPSITSVSPNSGPTTGGTSVTISGSGFTGATSVAFGGAAASGVVVNSDSQITAVSPGGSGAVNVTVTTPSGSSPIVAGSQFTYAAPPSTTTAAPPATPPPSSGYYVDPGLSAQLVSSLLTVLQSATSPDALEAQGIILRRAALEGDVVGSRVPPPKNISEIGGYINLLTKLNETTMRQQSLAGILGIAGPSQPLGWISNVQPLSMVSVTNDRPAGPSQASVPLTVLVRSDFVAGVQAAQKAIHQLGAYLPFTGSPAISLPPGTPGAPPPSDLLLYCGRVLNFASAAALANPQTDPLVLGRAPGGTGAYTIFANVLSAASNAAPPANYDALQCTATTSNTIQLTNVPLVDIGPIMAQAGFYPASPLPTPANNTQSSWSRLQNTTGLVVGKTKLGDELGLLYRPDAIVNSVLASMTTWVWNGKTFVSA